MLHNSGHIRRPLLIKRHSKSEITSEKLSLWKRRYKESYKCINSKTVILILFCSFSMSLTNNCIFEGANYYSEVFMFTGNSYSLLYAFKSLVLVFYPLAGFLSDKKYGRFKMITRSSQFFLLNIFLGITFCAILMTGFLLSFDMPTLFIFFSCLLGVVLFPVLVPIIASLVMFNANIIQFGVDQLQDSPADHQSLFIYWYVWTYYMGVLIAQICGSSFSVFIQASYLFVLPMY